MQTRVNRRPRGMALALTLIILTVIVVLGFGLVTLGIQNLTTADAERYSKTALFAAEAGANRAMMQINTNTLTNTTFTYVASNMATSASVVVTVGPGTANVNGVSLTVPANFYYIRSQGAAKAGKFRRTVGVMAMRGAGGSMFPYAAFGDVEVDLSGGGMTDSYDSRVPGYSGYATAAKTKEGSVGTNAVTKHPDAAVKLTGGYQVNGDVEIGAGGTAEIGTTITVGGGSSISGDGNVTNGSYSAMESPLALPPVSIPAATSTFSGVTVSSTLPSASSGPIYYSGTTEMGNGETLKLTKGDYIFDTLSIKNGGKLEIVDGAGPVTIYIKGSLNVDGEINNSSKKSSNMIFKLSPEITGNQKFVAGVNGYFAVYAPSAEVEIAGGAAIHGAVVGKTVKMTGGTPIHYDVALAEVMLPNGTLQIKSWQRM